MKEQRPRRTEIATLRLTEEERRILMEEADICIDEINAFIRLMNERPREGRTRRLSACRVAENQHIHILYWARMGISGISKTVI